jgi:hypothetical protein
MACGACDRNAAARWKMMELLHRGKM